MSVRCRAAECFRLVQTAYAGNSLEHGHKKRLRAQENAIRSPTSIPTFLRRTHPVMKSITDKTPTAETPVFMPS